MSNDINQNMTPAPVEPAGIGERGVPGVGRTKRKSPFRLLPIVIGIVLILIFGAVAVGVAVKRWTAQHHAESAAAKAEAAKDKPTDERHDFAADQAKIEKARAEEAAAAAAAASAALATPAHADAASSTQVTASTGAGGAAAAAAPASAVETPASRKLDGDVVLKFEDAKTPGGSGAAGSKMEYAKDGLDAKFRSSKLDAVKAGLMPSRKFLMLAGSTIPCGQRSVIVTDYPGMTSCHVTKDVYSANGEVKLIEAGSEVVGEQRQALMQGQARIFVIWTRLTTPLGVEVQLDSPAADALGGSGLPAYVDTHFWTRFGGALMVSLIGDAGQALSGLASNSGGGSNRIQFSNTSSAGESVAAETLKNTINVPPTAYSKYGSRTTIFVARDVDFSDVYELVTP
ncbi:type IV secretion system protein VirB10 [Burkholderia cenocepacia]|uniref:type IV secretion system protein VirB10 n=1 Tax=Burkholderia cenocepacia TaxID=95486 RepID=UPI002B251F83|nr:type IV secretion system protein VirB10 [Burkholderia cenocepacia]MEB2558788.1 type IV secretion system protein VirB10 [Burkholderia cenocepacia]